MNIYYICPDLVQPSGGVRRLYNHVEYLRGDGFPAYILHFKKGFHLNWFIHDVPIKYMNDTIQWNPTDILVFPEGLPLIIQKFKNTPFRKVVIALSHSYIFPQLNFGENWRDYNIEAVLTPSKIVRDFVQWSMHYNRVYLFQTSIDHELFNNKNAQKNLQVAYISRKDNTAEIIAKILASRKVQNIPFIKIENQSIENYAQMLKSSVFFLTTAAHEGIHRSVLEAMACGCICVGYDAIGAKDYIKSQGKNQNFILAENMNYIELSKILEKAVEQYRKDQQNFINIINNGFATAAKFSTDIEKESVLNFWREFL